MLQSDETNPKDIKMHLARQIIGLYHSKKEIKDAEENFQALFQKKNIKVELPKIVYDSTLLDNNGQISAIDFIFSTGKYKSKNEVRRLIQQGAVKVNGEKSQELFITPKNDSIIQVGKGIVFKLVDSNIQNQNINNDKTSS